MTPLQFEPGTQYAYSNAGTNTAGRIVSKSSAACLTRSLWTAGFSARSAWTTRPSGPARCNFRGSPKSIARRRMDKSDLEEATLTQLSYPLNDPKRRSMPAGGLFSTASDCVKFCQMILNGGVVRKAGRYLSEAAAPAND